jgi:hypothetical protein
MLFFGYLCGINKVKVEQLLGSVKRKVLNELNQTATSNQRSGKVRDIAGHTREG